MNDLPTRLSFNRHGARVLDQQIDDALAQQKTERDAAWEAARASQAKQKALQGTISRDDLDTAKGGHVRAVRDLTGWHTVIRVNRATVVVPGPWGGERLVRIDKIIEVAA